MALAPNYYSRPTGKGRKKQNFAVRFLSGLFPVKGDSIGEIIRKMIFFVALVCFIYFGYTVVRDVGSEIIQQNTSNKFTNMFGETNIDPNIANSVLEKEPEILPQYIAAYNENNDLIGHIGLPDLTTPSDNREYTINYPVMQTTDNEYYLDHAVDHSSSIGGAIFADFRNTFDAGRLDGNTVLYGHNIDTGGYFAKLSRYLMKTDMSFYKAHPVVEFNTIYEESTWKIFAACLFNVDPANGEVFDYTNVLQFASKDAFNEFILGIMDRSVIFTDVDLEYGDNILTLSTCYWPMGRQVETRAVVFARKVRKGENPNVDINKAIYNDKEYRFEKQATRYGTKWNGRVWDTSYLKSYSE